MHKALEAPPGVEAASIQIDTNAQSARFKVKEPKGFKIDEVIETVNAKTGFRASLAKKGAAVTP